jgi:hypothetical protein
MRRDPRDYEGQGMELVYIARSVGEGEKIEALLDGEGIDYTIQVEQYRSGVIFASVRAGAFFYVPVEAAAPCRQILAREGYEPTPAA